MKRNLKSNWLQPTILVVLLAFPPLLLNEVVAGKRSAVPVSPGLEIEVLDPGVDPSGNPAVRINRSSGFDGEAQIEIPPVILVHRYYYTGDRDFQGPMVPGGPSIVVATNPRTNERQYVNVQMLPGAPRVKYTRRSITYDYGHQSIVVSFHYKNRAKVAYTQGTSLPRFVVGSTKQVQNAASGLAERTGLSKLRSRVASDANNVIDSAIGRVRETGESTTQRIRDVWKMLPIAGLLSGSPDEAELRNRASELRSAAEEARDSELSIPTNR